MADEEEADEEARNKKKIIYIVVAVLLICIVIIAVIVAVLFLTVLKKKEVLNAVNATFGQAKSRELNANESQNGGNDTQENQPITLLKNVFIMSDKQVPLTESSNFCKSKGMTLLITSSHKNERDVVAYLKANQNKYEECSKYFIGFHSVREKKFMSTDGNQFYPSLDTSYDAIKPNPDRMCAEVSLNSNLAVREVPCSEVQSLCFVCEYKEEGVICPQDKYLTSCYQHLILQTPKSAWIGYEFCELLRKPIWGLMPIDRKIPDLRREYFKNIGSPKCKDVVYGVAVRYTNKYQTMDRKPMQYNSSRFLPIEPLYDCLAYDSTRGFNLVTESCLAPNCALCAPLSGIS